MITHRTRLGNNVLCHLLMRAAIIPADGVLDVMLATRSCTPKVVLDIPLAMAQSLRGMWLAIISQIGSGTLLLTKAASECDGGILLARKAKARHTSYLTLATIVCDANDTNPFSK
jgi:hypothetical protein